MQINEMMLDLGKKAKEASRAMTAATSAAKAKAILALADLLAADEAAIVAANKKDLEAAEKNGMDPHNLDRLTISPKVLNSMIDACREVGAMADPVGAMDSTWKRPNGLLVGRMRIPLGVVAMIYESRPNVTVDASILCLLAGNAVILRGGSEAFHSNTHLAGLVRKALVEAGLPEDAMQLIPTTDREAVTAMLKLEEYIDLMIPRGGEGLIRFVCEHASMTVLKHYKGVCHIYVDKDVNQAEAVEIIHNAKTHRPAVCNALECFLVHRDVAAEFLPKAADRLLPSGVTLLACPESLKILGDKAQPVGPNDFGEEFHDLRLAVKVVGDRAEAQDHIAAYGSKHTDIILTTNHSEAMHFLREVDSSMTAVNTSTRFNDGGELGLGAEIGISTTKLHSFGPMGVKELTTTKFVVFGEGQIRE